MSNWILTLSKWAYGTLLILAALTLAATVASLLHGCVFPGPQVDPVTNKIISNQDGSTDFAHYLTPGAAKTQIDKALNSKGFQRYKADVAAIAAREWINISKWAGIGAFACVIGWYLTKIREAGGAAVICILFSLVAVSMAEIVNNIGKIVIVLVALGVIGLGVYLRKKTVMTIIRNILK